MTGVLRRSVDYTDKDFDALRARLQSTTKSVFPKWTNKQIANFANILVELFCFVGDTLTFYQDNQAGESRITSATQRKNIIALAKLIGFEANGASAATVAAVISLPASPAAAVPFPKGTFVSTESITDPIRMQLLADVEIAAGADPAEIEVDVEHSESHSESFVSTELPNQEFTLSRTPFLEESQGASATEITDAVDAWEEVDDFLSSTATDRHFVVVVDQNDRATVRFGNGVNGAIPAGGVTVNYKTGGGEAGNIEAGSLRKIIGVFTDSAGNPVNPTVTNELAASGGADRMTTEEIREQAPASLRVLQRTVAREDFEIAAEEVPGVARALMLTSNEDPLIDENTGHLYVIPTGGGVPSDSILEAVETMITVTKPKTLTFQVDVRVPVYNEIDVSVRVFLRQGYSGATVKANIEEALEEYFAVQNADGTKNTLVDFGFYYKDSAGDADPLIPWSDVLKQIVNASGVRKVADTDNGLLLNGFSDDVLLAVKEFPKLGTVTVVNHETGATL